jgi:hypothetical protein
MGFKSKARKHLSKSGEDGSGGKQRKSDIEGSVRCAVSGCDNWADKRMGGRSMAYENVAEVFDSLSKDTNRVPICKPHYREYKKETKEDREFRW